jgi:hypothetical protein
MNEHSNPIEFLIEFAWASGADLFVVNNAKNELNKLKQDNNRWLSCEREALKLKTENQKLQAIFNYPVAYGLINDRNDLYDLRLMNNPYHKDENVIPLYSNREEFLSGDWKGYANYGKFTK